MTSPSILNHQLSHTRELTMISDAKRGPFTRWARRRQEARSVIAAELAPESIVLRSAVDSDSAAVERLQQLDAVKLPRGPRLLAETDGHIVAATDVRTGMTVADPFSQTAGVQRLLRMRAAQLRLGVSA